MIRVSLAGLWLLVSAVSSFAADHPCADGAEVVGKPVKGDNRGFFQLEGDASRYFPAGVFLPNPDAQTLPANATVRLYLSGKGEDRYGQRGAFVFVGDRFWQSFLLEQGYAVVQPANVPHNCLTELLDAEKRARQARAGLWADGNISFQASDLEGLSRSLGKYIIVEGKVASIGDRSRRLYLNFGQNWSQDFTVTVAKRGAGAFKGAINALMPLKGAKVRIRGILESNRGPLIRLFDAGQIEILED